MDAALRSGLRSRGTTALLIGVPLLLRLVCFLELRHALFFRFLLVDARTYHEMAAQIASGTFHPHEPFWQPPLYPYFLAVLYKLAGPHPDVARLVQALLGSLGCLLVFRIAGRLFGRRAAWISWACAALYAPWILLDLQLLNAGPAVFLLLLGVWLLLGSDPARAPSLRMVAASGLVLGLACITVATLLVTLPVAAGWLYLVARKKAAAAGIARTQGRSPDLGIPRRPAKRETAPVRAAALFLAGAALPILVVTGANLAVSGEPVMISYNGGINFWIGNNPDYDHTVSIRPGREWKALVNEPMRAGVPNPGATSSWFVRKSLAWIARDPAGWLKLLLYKTRLLLRGDEIARNEEIYPFRGDSLLLRLLLWIHGLAFPFGLLLPLAGAGMVMVLRGPRPPGAGFLAALSGILAVAVIAFFVTSRYRLPLVPLLIPFAGAALSRWKGAWSRGRRELLAPGTVFVLLLAVANAGTPSMASDFNSDAYSDLGTFYYGEGRYDEAATQYETALRLDPGNTEAANNLGAIRLQQHRLDEAEGLFRKVLEVYPDDPKALVNTGSIWYYRGDPYRAGEYYLLVHKSDPKFPSAEQNLHGIELTAEKLEREKLAQDPEAFLSSLEHSFLADPGNEFLFKRLEPLLEERGLYARALRVIEARMQKAPQDPGLLAMQARCRARLTGG
jgi:tetratricopeptide (TPR) repeat protein